MNQEFKVKTEEFGDYEILRYRCDSFQHLTLRQKQLVYYLTEAALWGREIIYAQHYRHNLLIKRTLEHIYRDYKGDRSSYNFELFATYLKKFWFSNGIHHHDSRRKMIPDFTENYFRELLNAVNPDGLPLQPGQTVDDLYKKLAPLLFNYQVDTQNVSQDTSRDLLQHSASAFYDNVQQSEAEAYYQQLLKTYTEKPPEVGINSQLTKLNGQLQELPAKIGGLYSAAIEKVVWWLKKAATVAETRQQQETIEALITYYRSGRVEDWEKFNICWVQTHGTAVDFVSGFVENYTDPLGYKGTWESSVFIRDAGLSEQLQQISREAGWFERHLPVPHHYRKENPRGISYNVAQTAMLAGDCAPYTYMGVNLPNSDWLRREYGSKSFSAVSIEAAYFENAKTNGLMEAFFTPEQMALYKQHGHLASKMHTALHEVIGHGSGQQKKGVAAPAETLRNFYNPLEEARADLVALYFMLDKHLEDMGLVPTLDVGHSAYDYYIVNALLVQLRRLQMGATIEQAHSRCRHMIASWVFEQGKNKGVIAAKRQNGSSYFVINDYQALRQLFGELLYEVQRIKSEGDYEAARHLFTTYGIYPDKDLHYEVRQRVEKLNLPGFAGFINPKFQPRYHNGQLEDIEITYPDNFTEQMLYYARNYAVLPVE